MWDFTQPQGKQVSLSEFHKLLWKIPDVWSKITRKFLSTITLARVIYCASSLSPKFPQKDEKRARYCLPRWHLETSILWMGAGKVSTFSCGVTDYLILPEYRISVLRRRGMSLYLPCPGVKINLRFWAMGDISLSYHGI